MTARRVWRLGDNIDTDVLAPGIYMKKSIAELAIHCLEAVEPRFAEEVRRGDIVVGGITDGNDRLPMLAGAYLAGTGPAEQDQAFVAGVVQQLIGLQNNVGWTPVALAEERDYRRMTAIGYAVALALVIAVGTFAYLTWLR